MNSKQIAKIRDKTYGGMDDKLNKKRACKRIRQEHKKEIDYEKNTEKEPAD